ncbi:hypothetical protein CSUI_009457 [Cystoisospora suis]|uniref:Uncharacterized protein n=1 Tax=Cystoisospora suis TaxID=483139 RepID=A0A2C6KGR0_9APIC|nr:hypothetical protein CSUI_009457 [Cystoisospora suis]
MKRCRKLVARRRFSWNQSTVAETEDCTLQLGMGVARATCCPVCSTVHIHA